MNQGKEIKPAERPKKHTARNVILIALAVLVFAGGILAFAFRRYINIFTAGISKSEEQIHSMQIENDKKTQDILNELVVVTMRDLTDEERRMRANGELTPEQALILIKGGTLEPIETTAAEAVTTAPVEIVTTEIVEVTETAATSATEETDVVTTQRVAITTTASTTASTTATKPIENEAALRARIEGIIAEIYLLRADYLNAIDKTIYEAKREYINLPKENHTLQGKMRFVTNTLVPRGNALEAECDAKIDKLLTELEDILVKLGESTAIIDEIKRVYQEQKDLKLTELTNEYSSKLK